MPVSFPTRSTTAPTPVGDRPTTGQDQYMPAVHVGDPVDGGRYVAAGGQVIWHFHGGEPNGPPTVLLHGAFASAATWGAQIAGFMDVGLQVYVPERSVRGHRCASGRRR